MTRIGRTLPDNVMHGGKLALVDTSRKSTAEEQVDAALFTVKTAARQGWLDEADEVLSMLDWVR